MQVPGHDWLYAIGDVNGRVLLTHMGKYQARIAAEHILGNPSAAEHGADGRQSPRVVFTDPQVAAVGHTERTAREAGLDVHILEVGDVGQRRRLLLRPRRARHLAAARRQDRPT